MCIWCLEVERFLAFSQSQFKFSKNETENSQNLVRKQGGDRRWWSGGKKMKTYPFSKIQKAKFSITNTKFFFCSSSLKQGEKNSTKSEKFEKIGKSEHQRSELTTDCKKNQFEIRTDFLKIITQRVFSFSRERFFIFEEKNRK